MAKKKTRGKLAVTKFKAAPYNPRKITDAQLSALSKSMSHFGDLSGVVVNKRNDTLVSGHQRIKTMKGHDTEIHTDVVKKDKFGTVQLGFIEVYAPEGAYKVPLRIVDWDDRTEKLANIAANNLGGDFDNQKLGKLLAELDQESFDVELIGVNEAKKETLIRRHTIEETGEVEDKYVKKLTSPIYKPKGKKPKVSELFDVTKTNELKDEIRESRIPEDVKQFLLHAAERHTKIRYDLCAEYYAHAPKRIQELMENTALVIVDHDKALEHGYLKMTEELMDMVENGQED